MTVIITQNTQKLAYRIDEAVKASGLGRSFLYERMADGSLKSIKIGGRRLILRDELVAFLKCEKPVSLSAAVCSVGPEGASVSRLQALPGPVEAPNSQMILPLE
ncbi:helix-turn-helix domain-containing protein [Asticcacaulis sp.]|uniref:helix-turn-helix domain-containing protein n=1 Tax=Asticcacaulis sp. TaxID=1872648 RepID=UPI00260731EB|nr:helix-turn-helix domain-containing protein [Asticcacaulis sp.]